MQLRTIIIDDEPSGIYALRLLIQKHIPELRVVAQLTDADGGLAAIEDYKPEVLFLDISMPGMSGFELLERLHWKEFNLIFTTAHQEFGLQALKNNAIDYLLKPVDPQSLRTATDRVLKRIANQALGQRALLELLSGHKFIPSKKIIVNSRLGTEYLDADDIVYLESFSNYTHIVLTQRRPLSSSRTLLDYENQLCSGEFQFMRTHKSYIVNLRNVSRFLKESEEIVMINEARLPLSKSRKEQFFQWLNR